MPTDKFYITSPIYYVNDRPHVGHAYTTLLADTLARYRRLQGDEVHFLTGVDENSQKTIDAAEKSGEDVVSYTNRLALIWKSTWEKLGINFTDFIRTTEPRHTKTVQEVWQRVWDRGDIYKGMYSGLYCKGHEAFIKESDLVDGFCPDHKAKPEHITEENYFFRLSKYQKELLAFYDARPNFLIPETRFNEIKSFVRNGLEDISISREKQTWGIPVPQDPSHVIYVWFDALVNYISGVGIKAWNAHPADVHVIGKDIIRFHAVIWPAMLMSAGLALPQKVATHGFFTMGGVKISKSLGNTIDPIPLAEKYNTDALRYFFLREIPFGEDGDFSLAKFHERYIADLANGLGNLVARVAKLGETLGDIEVSDHDMALLQRTPSYYHAAFDRIEINKVLSALWDEISNMDKNINDRKIWEKKGDALKNDIITFSFTILYLARPLEPFLPNTVQKIRDQFVFDPKRRVLKITKGEILFPRIQ